ncbi:MAG: DeoR/GlpR transcriptional regulator [Clostridia bacterium]|nr:DeoR/GlpR transcriptional regulator [Clostridia bacterium]
MKLNKRQEMIMERLNESGQVRVSKLSEELYFSEMTIRRDLKYMEKEGLLKRVHGGAIENVFISQYPVNYRSNFNKEQKKIMAEQALKYVKNDQIIFFNSSSTLAFIIPYLSNYRNIKIITNSVYLVPLIEQLHIPCYLTGGKYDEIEKCLSGKQTEDFLRSVNPDLALLSCEALSDDGNVTDSDQNLAEIAKIVIKKSKFSVLLMDRSKIGTVCTYDICNKEELNDVILF